MSLAKMRQGTKAWHQTRLNFIGGSEIGILAGFRENYSGTTFSLFHEKSRNIPARSNSGNKRTEAGLAFEAPVIKWVAKRRGWKPVIRGRYAINDNVQVMVGGVPKGMGASLDFEIMDPGPDAAGVAAGGDVLRGIGTLTGPGVAQIKTCDYAIFKEKWTDNEAPHSIVLQLQHEIACAGYNWGVIVLLLGINDYRVYFYEARPIVIEYCEKLVRTFWNQVRDEQTPGIAEIEGSEADAYTLSKLFPPKPAVKGEMLDMTGSNEWPGLCAEWSEARRARLTAEKIEDRAEKRVKFLMEGSACAKGSGWIVSTTDVAPSPGRPATAGEIIGVRKGHRKYEVKEVA